MPWNPRGAEVPLLRDAPSRTVRSIAWLRPGLIIFRTSHLCREWRRGGSVAADAKGRVVPPTAVPISWTGFLPRSKGVALGSIELMPRKTLSTRQQHFQWVVDISLSTRYGAGRCRRATWRLPAWLQLAGQSDLVAWS